MSTVFCQYMNPLLLSARGRILYPDFLSTRTKIWIEDLALLLLVKATVPLLSPPCLHFGQQSYYITCTCTHLLMGHAKSCVKCFPPCLECMCIWNNLKLDNTAEHLIHLHYRTLWDNNQPSMLQWTRSQKRLITTFPWSCRLLLKWKHSSCVLHILAWMSCIVVVIISEQGYHR